MTARSPLDRPNARREPHRASTGRPAQRALLLLATVGLLSHCGHIGIGPLEIEDGSTGGAESGGAPSASGGANLGTGSASNGGSSSGGTQAGGGAPSGGDQGNGGQGGDASSGGQAGEGGEGGEPNGSGGSAPSNPCSTGAFGPLEPIVGLEVEGDKWSPSLTADGLILVFAVSDADGESIYQATRASRDEPFGAATLIELQQSTRQVTPFIASDGLALYYAIEGFGGASTRDLWVAWRGNRQEQFGGRMPLDSLNSSTRDHLPWLSFDEQTIYFTTSRRTEGWLSEIWTAQRVGVDGYDYTFSSLSAVPTERVDSEDGSPSLTPDGLTLYFTSDRGGEFDVWSVRRTSLTAPFQGAEREDALSEQGEEINVRLSPDGHEMYLSSTGDSHQELFVSQRDCPE